MTARHLCLLSAVAAAAAASLRPSLASAPSLDHPTTGLPRLAGGKPNLTAPVPRTADGRRVANAGSSAGGAAAPAP